MVTCGISRFIVKSEKLSLANWKLRKMMQLKSVFVAIAGFGLLTAPTLAELPSQSTETVISQTLLKVVKLEADWCASCQIVKKNVKAAKAENAFEHVDFAVIDYTDKDKEAFWARAAELGVEAQLKKALKGKPKTGKAYVFDATSLEIIDVITKKDDAAEIAQKLSATS
jgi:thiol-disulfide isomerase/thioredoxin